MAKKNTKFEFDLLEAFQEEQVISQATLSGRLWITAGLLNFLVKRAVGKGLVKIKRVLAKRYTYFFTAKGFVKKSRLVTDYLNNLLHVNLLVGDFYNAQLVCDELVNQFGANSVLAPKSLYIKTYNNSKRLSQKLVSK